MPNHFNRIGLVLMSTLTVSLLVWHSFPGTSRGDEAIPVPPAQVEDESALDEIHVAASDELEVIRGRFNVGERHFRLQDGGFLIDLVGTFTVDDGRELEVFFSPADEWYTRFVVFRDLDDPIEAIVILENEADAINPATTQVIIFAEVGWPSRDDADRGD